MKMSEYEARVAVVKRFAEETFKDYSEFTAEALIEAGTLVAKEKGSDGADLDELLIQAQEKHDLA